LLPYRREDFAWSVFGQGFLQSTGTSKEMVAVLIACFLWQAKCRQINLFNVSTTNWGHLLAW